jgi:glycosyltransferase involved in cell wall biosynthesis
VWTRWAGEGVDSGCEAGRAQAETAISSAAAMNGRGEGTGPMILPGGSGSAPARTAATMVSTVANPALSIVVPMFNEEGNVAPLLERIVAILEKLPGSPSYEIVLVNDGSTDATLDAIRAEMAKHAHIVLVSLSRNFGHQLAATAGIEIATGDAVVLMDGDLQDPPELIADFLQKWRDGFDVVYAVRRTRKGESVFKILTASIFYRTIKRLTKVSIPVDTGDFRLMSRRVVEALRRSPERHRFLRGMVSWVGFNQVGVPYDRDERLSGTTKYPLPKMVRFAIDGITSFSDIPLRFASYFGFAVSAIAFVYALVVMGYKLFSLNPPGYTPGWASTICAVLFLGGVQLMSLGILGEYLGRVYDEVKGRPLYLVAGIERS